MGRWEEGLLKVLVIKAELESLGSIKITSKVLVFLIFLPE